MTDTIKLENGATYDLIQKLSFGEVRRFQKSVGNLLGMDKKINDATPEELEQLANEGFRANEEQMDIVQNILTKCLGFSQEQLDKTSYSDAILLFNEIFKASTEIKKKSDKPYG